jgi:uncharacterized protein (DUF1499 family)
MGILLIMVRVIRTGLIVLGLLAALLAIVSVGGLFVLSRTQGQEPVHSPRLAEGELRECPETPNCVSTQAPPDDATHFVEPIPWQGSRDAALDQLVSIIESRPRMRVLETGESFIRAAEHSSVFGFTDDVEFYVSADGSVIHMRSAARVGQGDMNVNRERYRAFRRRLTSEG